MKRAKNTRTLTVRKELNFTRERGHGLRTLTKGDRVPVSYSAGTGYGTAYLFHFGEHWTSCIEASKGPELFTNWPKDWAVSQ